MFLSVPSKKSFINKKITLNIDSAESSTGQGKLKYVVYLPRLLLEAGLLISFVSYFNWCNEAHVRRTKSSNTTSKKAQKRECLNQFQLTVFHPHILYS
jgi:predicted histidine transporter YuiF (NhaC family)